MKSTVNRKVFITGGGGYVGTQLVELLLENNFEVVVYDTFWFSPKEIFGPSNKLTVCLGDIRDIAKLKSHLIGCTDFIHLACISNDPSFDLNPKLSKEINYDCFADILEAAKNVGIERFIYASSSSVYGVREEEFVTEDLKLSPLTDYSKYKALCEDLLLNAASDNFVVCALRPATVCGYSKRQRLDVVVNILTNHAVNNGKIKVFGGTQKRPNIHIKDMCLAYLTTLLAKTSLIQGQVFNVGHENLRVSEIAALVRDCTGVDKIEIHPSDDLRSYHISSKKFYETFSFEPKYSVHDAICELKEAFEKGILNDPLTDPKYFNVKFILDNKVT